MKQKSILSSGLKYYYRYTVCIDDDMLVLPYAVQMLYVSG